VREYLEQLCHPLTIKVLMNKAFFIAGVRYDYWESLGVLREAKGRVQQTFYPDSEESERVESMIENAWEAIDLIDDMMSSEEECNSDE